MQYSVAKLLEQAGEAMLVREPEFAVRGASTFAFCWLTPHAQRGQAIFSSSPSSLSSAERLGRCCEAYALGRDCEMGFGEVLLGENFKGKGTNKTRLQIPHRMKSSLLQLSDMDVN